MTDWIFMVKNIAIWFVAWSLLIWFVIFFYLQILKPMFLSLFQGKKIKECKEIIESTPDEDERIKKLSKYDISIVKIAYDKAKIPKGEVVKNGKIPEESSARTEPVATGTGGKDKSRDREPAKQRSFQTKTFGGVKRTDFGCERIESDHD